MVDPVYTVWRLHLQYTAMGPLTPAPIHVTSGTIPLTLVLGFVLMSHTHHHSLFTMSYPSSALSISISLADCIAPRADVERSLHEQLSIPHYSGSGNQSGSACRGDAVATGDSEIRDAKDAVSLEDEPDHASSTHNDSAQLGVIHANAQSIFSVVVAEQCSLLPALPYSVPTFHDAAATTLNISTATFVPASSLPIREDTLREAGRSQGAPQSYTH